MARKNWLSSFTGDNPVQDPDPITDAMPDLDDVTAPGAADGDDALSSQVESLRDKLDTLCKMTGDSLNDPEKSICNIIDRDHTAGDAGWIRLGERTSAPTGAAAPEAVWIADSLSDQTANGHDLTVEGGTAIYAAIEGLKCWWTENDYLLDIADSDGLNTTGAFTAVFLASMHRETALMSFLSNGASGVNMTISLRFNDAKFAAFQEYGGDAKLLGYFTATKAFRGALASGLLSLEEWSASQVLENYQYCRKIS